MAKKRLVKESKKPVKRKLKEYIDEFDYDFDYCKEDVADALEAGWWHGQTRSGRNWGLTIDGNSGSFTSPRFAEFLTQEVAYPVRDGYFNFIGLDLIIPDSIKDEFDGDEEVLRKDLEIIGCDDEDIDKFLNGEIEELETWIDFYIDIDDAEEDEEDDEEEYDESVKKSTKKSIKEDWDWEGQIPKIAQKMADAFESSNEKIISWEDFDNELAVACDDVLGIDILDSDDGIITVDGKDKDIQELEADVRTILATDGWETIYEGEDEGGLINPNASLELTPEQIIYRALNYFYNYGYNEYENDGTNTEDMLSGLVDEYSQYWDSDEMEKFGITESVDKKSRKNLKEAKSGLYLDVDAYKDETVQHLKDFSNAYKKVVDDFAVGVECDDGIPCDANEFIGTKKAMDLFDNSFAEKSFDELRISDWCDEVIDNIKKWTPGTPLKEGVDTNHNKKADLKGYAHIRQLARDYYGTDKDKSYEELKGLDIDEAHKRLGEWWRLESQNVNPVRGEYHFTRPLVGDIILITDSHGKVVEVKDLRWKAVKLGEVKKSIKESKQLTETFKGEDIINDLIDRAKSWIDDGYDTDDAVRQAIDDGLIYGRDVIDLAEHYGVIDDGELIERFYDDLFNDMYGEVSDYAEEHADDERKSNATREYEIAIKDLDVYVNEDELYDEDGDINYTVLDDAIWDCLKDELEDGSDLDSFDYDIDGDVIRVFDITYDFDESFQKNKRHTLKENKKKAQRKTIKENKKQAAKKPLTESKKSTKKALKENKKSTKKSLKESVTITMDEEDFLDLLMDRVAFWTKTRYCPEYDLFEKYYEDAVYGGSFDGINEGINYIVDNDYVNNGRIVYPDDYDYAEIKAKYEDGSLEDEGVVYTVEENGETYFLII